MDAAVPETQAPVDDVLRLPGLLHRLPRSKTSLTQHIESKKHLTALKKDKYQALIREVAESFEDGEEVEEEEEQEAETQTSRRSVGRKRVRRQPRRHCSAR